MLYFNAYPPIVSVSYTHLDVYKRQILVELGKRRMVGGQEDMIVDVALDLRNNK